MRINLYRGFVASVRSFTSRDEPITEEFSEDRDSFDSGPFAMASSAQEPSLGSSTPVDAEEQAELEVDTKVNAWLKEKVAAEIAEIKERGGNAIPMTVSNMAIVREDNLVINRVEMDTKFDFNLIKQILVSSPVSCPYKPGFVYVNVLLFTDKPLPLIIPYLYQKQKGNKLTEWLLINADGIRVRHHIDKFQ